MQNRFPDARLASSSAKKRDHRSLDDAGTSSNNLHSSTCYNDLRGSPAQIFLDPIQLKIEK